MPREANTWRAIQGSGLSRQVAVFAIGELSRVESRDLENVLPGRENRE